MPKLEFWISIGSTYSYLSVSRIGALAEREAVSIDWRPFSVREIMTEMDNIPFATKPVKAAYMWRDIERRARDHGLSPQLPAPYPLENFDRANRIGVLASEEGWFGAYVTATYQAWFEEGVPAGTVENLTRVLPGCGQQMDRVVADAESERIGAAYAAATQDARDRGIFGAPSFVCEDGELFWGDDRLEAAIEWARR
ncbi:2-hydroxychromene-2-carboxylate isomerase family protein [Pseudooceanicola batsensis HTCC2597]|uniref:2-hydroxychromene-2-carboxylate isomerase n=1 Tax=Pseudooceanicola batsensis (strain ATCC BAA-863 / DSM 15984 / KCTC 12145 / HTCC2597) TaxID=252305 RepID=A3TWA2_PSEBH|nr:DsbA family protein [Pseudooceanicola batsensis]EAQ03898.1 2-hydroxychromene-2-carboxylate isomerase family protein [Pseudooceanicola batsensis HTCC2597]